MLPENVNRNAVLQSITDTWLPLIGMVAAIILAVAYTHLDVYKRQSLGLMNMWIWYYAKTH